MRIIILGSNGQVGKSLRMILNNDKTTFLTKQDCNFESMSDIQNIFETHRPDLIINCAAYTNVDGAESDAKICNIINNEAVKNIAILSKKNKTFLIHLSTDYVFDGNSKRPYLETDDVNPLGVYAKSKYRSEQEIIKSKCKSIIIRTSWVFSEFGNNFLKTMLKISKNKEEINVIDDQYGCPTYALDIAHAIKTIVHEIKNNNPHGGIYHFSGNEPCTWFQFAKEIFKYSNRYNFNSPNLIPIKSHEYKTKASRPMYSILNCNKIKREFNINSSDWKAGIKDAIHNLNLKDGI
tara:strand:+ start:29895 stop:30773 length:879 start_codon:yes stop_codon:yes gene_type:complete